MGSTWHAAGARRIQANPRELGKLDREVRPEQELDRHVSVCQVSPGKSQKLKVIGKKVMRCGQTGGQGSVIRLTGSLW